MRIPRVLAIVAHPDDEAWCSGLLALQADAGLAVHLCVVCKGDLGGMPELAPADRAQVRRNELQRAAQLIGCELHHLEVGDSEIVERFHNDYVALEWQVRDVIRLVDPDLLIVPPPDDYHQHHRAVSELALSASTNAPNASLKGDLPPSSGVPTTLYTQPMPPGPFVPDIYADISSTFERKLAALRSHESQHPYLAKQFGADYVNLVRLTAEMHGAACGVPHAEGYAMCRKFPRLASTQRLSAFFPTSREG